MYNTRNNVHFPDILALCPDKIAFDWINCLISYKNNTKNKNNNLTVKLIISQEQSWPCGLLLYLICHNGYSASFQDQIHNLLVKYCFVLMFLLDSLKSYFEHCM